MLHPWLEPKVCDERSEPFGERGRWEGLSSRRAYLPFSDGTPGAVPTFTPKGPTMYS